MLSQPNHTNHQVPKADDAGRNAPDEATTAVTDQAAQGREQAVRAAADTARQDTEAERTTMEGGLNTATQSFQQIIDPFMQVLASNGPHSVELAQRWSEKVQALAQASTVQAQRTQENPQEVCGLVQDRLTKDIEAVTAILSNRLVEDFVADQSDPVRQRLQEMIDANRRMGELVIRIAEQMSRILPGQPIQNADQARRAA